MPQAFRVAPLIPLLLLFTLVPLMIALTGCASKPARDWDDHRVPSSVSAREYGYVRPMLNDRMPETSRPTGSAMAASLSRAGSAGDPWVRIRTGESLGIANHPRVAEILAQLARRPDYLTGLHARARPYLTTIIAELERAKLPSTLALLPEIESAFDPRAVSPKSAAGLWQFMPDTAEEMGLRRDQEHDARHDVLASTQAAIRYLRELHRLFDGDWALALAAYNAGPGRVQAARAANRAAGQPDDYWSLDLPRETQEYVPRLLAVAALVRHSEIHDQRTASRLVAASATVSGDF